MRVKPRVVGILRPQVFISHVAGDTVEERLQLLVLCIHFLGQIPAVLNDIRIGLAQRFILEGIFLVQLFQEFLFMKVDYLNALITDDFRLEHSVPPAFHHFLKAELSTMSNFANNSFDYDILDIARQLFSTDRERSRMLHQVEQLKLDLSFLYEEHFICLIAQVVDDLARFVRGANELVTDIDNLGQGPVSYDRHLLQ